MMIFNSFTAATDYNFGAQWPNGGPVFLPTKKKKTFEGICLALSGKLRQNELWVLLHVFKTIM